MAGHGNGASYEDEDLRGHNHPDKVVGSGDIATLPAALAGARIVAPSEPPLAPERGPSSEAEVAEEVREMWLKGAMDAMQAGREIPVRDIPAEYGDTAILSAESTTRLYQQAHVRRFVVNVDIAALERTRRERAERLAAEREAATRAAEQWLARILTRYPGGPRGDAGSNGGA